MIKYDQFITEHKFWGKSNSEFLSWVESISDSKFAWIDTETTGLPSDNYEVQLTQISAIITKYNFQANTFEELDSYDKKLQLTQKSKDMLKTTRIKSVLKFNHYGQGGAKYHPEGETMDEFHNWLEQFESPVFVIQNAIFDMRFLNIRNKRLSFDNDVLDTKQIIQLFYLPTLQKLSETDPKYKDMISKIGTSPRDAGLISSSMSKIGPALGINMSGYHDALTDCRIMMEMFSKMMDFLKSHRDVDILKYQAERIKTIK